MKYTYVCLFFQIGLYKHSTEQYAQRSDLLAMPTYHIEPETKWPPFCRRRFQMFLNGNIRISIKISLKFATKGPIEKYSSIGSYNGLAPTRRQAIIWTSGG